MKNSMLALSLLGITVLSSCANTQAIRRKYDSAIEQARQEAESEIVGNESPQVSADFSDTASIELWVKNTYGLDTQKYSRWSKDEKDLVAAGTVKEFWSRLISRYPLMDKTQVTQCPIASGRNCSWQEFESIARETHNSNVRWVLDRRIANLEEDKQKAIEEDKGGIRKFWRAFGTILQGMGQGLQNAQQNSYQPMPAYQPATAYQPRREIANVYPTPSAPTSYTQFGNTLYGSDGSSYTRFGNTVYGSNGTSYTKFGNTTYGSDGTTYSRFGNTTYSSDGRSATRFGNTSYGSDGSSCTRFGNTTYCN